MSQVYEDLEHSHLPTTSFWTLIRLNFFVIRAVVLLSGATLIYFYPTVILHEKNTGYDKNI